MKTFEKIADLQSNLRIRLEAKARIGFVPTMGTLHQGHLSLIEIARQQSDVVVASIFVNPLQFNDKKDFQKYPRQLENDLQLLKNVNCDIVFIPDVSEMYPKPPEEFYDFGQLERVMEGAFRPGHFNGVAIVVKKLFDIVKPQLAFFGEKDFQQLLIIKELILKEKMPIKIVGCPIIRENDGLAMSSRNLRLSIQNREQAPLLYQLLIQAKMMLLKGASIEETKSFVDEKIKQNINFKLEYFEIANATTLTPVNVISQTSNIRAFIAAFLGEIRLIDNIEIV